MGGLAIKRFNICHPIWKKIYRAFIWTLRRSLISWAKVCSPTDGGYGSEDLKTLEEGTTLQSLVANARKARYYLTQVSLWTWKAKQEDSLLITRLLHIQDEINSSRFNRLGVRIP